MAHIHELYDFTTSAFILHPSEPKILLLKHKKIGKWLQPGGHIELNEDPEQALWREIKEETGLAKHSLELIQTADSPHPNEAKVLPLPFYFNVHSFGDLHKHIDICYLMRAKTNKLTNSPDGAEAIGWFSISEISELLKKGDLFDSTKQICEWIFNKYTN